jgi:3-oxoacyl-[acyl-carrier protein] reductase
LVTGGARGIGAAIGRKLMSEGHIVISCDRSPSEANDSATENLEVDIANIDEFQEAVNATAATWGRLDVLVNNAGISRHQELDQVGESDWDEVMAINLKAPFFGVQAAAEHLRKSGRGRVINIASELLHLGSPTLPHYTAAKGGLLALTRSLARALAPEVLVNAVVPGPVDTDMFHASPQFREDFGKTMPIGYLPDAAAIAETVAFLIGPGGAVYTGQQFNANGGLVMV